MAEVFEEFVGKEVCIGVPHRYENRLFFLTGVVLTVKSNFLILRIKDGIKQIPFDDIVEIRLKQGDDQ